MFQTARQPGSPAAHAHSKAGQATSAPYSQLRSEWHTGHTPYSGVWLAVQCDRTLKKRTELVVLITPTAVTDRSEARDVTRKFRNKRQGIFSTPENSAKTAL